MEKENNAGKDVYAIHYEATSLCDQVTNKVAYVKATSKKEAEETFESEWRDYEDNNWGLDSTIQVEINEVINEGKR